MLNQQEHFSPPCPAMGEPSTAFYNGGLFLFMNVKRECKQCGKVFYRPLAVINQRPCMFCSKPCRIAFEQFTPEKFWSRVDKNGPVPARYPELGPCWEWQHTRHDHGYGITYLNFKAAKAHRVAFYLHHGRWPMPYALHFCDNPPCCNPKHLFEGTHLENMRDAADKGRMRSNPHHGEDTWNAKLTWEVVEQIRIERSTLKTSMYTIAKKHGVSRGCISHVVNNHTWKPEHRPA